MSKSESRSGLVLELAEEFLERYRKGERPALKEYIDSHPELEAEIREVFPAMAMMEKIALTEEGEETEKPKEPKGKLPFEQLGDFRLIREVGRGGMGVVYEAEQVSLGRHVALKVLPQQIRDAKQRTRFEREAKAAAKLHHTNIVPVFGVGEQDGQPYYVMQFIQGLGLDAVLDELNRMQPGDAHTPSALPTGGEIRISRRDVSAANVARSLMTGEFQQATSDKKGSEPDPQRFFAPTLDQPSKEADSQNAPTSSVSASTRLSDSFAVSSSSITLPNASKAGHKTSAKKQTYWQSVANIGHQVADALDYAHKQGVQHRDIKPSNLLLDLRGTVWVTDFGLAKVAGPGADNLTHTGDVLGTLRYMPPEAFEGKSDIRGDVYSLGLTLYELIALRPAFSDRDRNKLIKQVTSGEPTRLDKINREIPRDLVTIIHKAIDREPGRRYPSAEEFASDLQRFIDDEPIQARRQTQIERYWRWARHNPGIAILGGALSAVLVIATVASLIVAGRMAKLADNEAKAADDERAARQDADDAKNREAQERAQAESAKQAAEESKQRAVQALEKAEENYTKARAAVNDYLTAVSVDERLQSPGLQGLRAQLLQSALKFYQDFLKERGNDPSLRRELAIVYYKVGEVYRDLGQVSAANAAFIQSRRLFEVLTTESPEDPDLQHGLAKCLHTTRATHEAIAILEKLINSDDPKYHADLGEFYNSAALADKTNASQAQQLEYLRKALLVRERLVLLKPDDPDARLGFGGSLNNIAIRLKEDRNAEALAMIQRSVEQAEAAFRIRPSHLLTARYLTIGLNNVAIRAKQTGEMDLAAAAHRRRVEVLDRRARDNPNIAGFDADLAYGQGLLLEALLEANQLDEAARAAEKGRDRLGETTEESIEYYRQASYFQLTAVKVALARAKTAPDPKSIIEPAAAEAVNALKRHAIAGWHDAKWLSTDSRSESLRQRADFQTLQAQMEQLAPAVSTAQQATATAEDKLLARQKILTIKETLASSLPPSRFVRRSLAQVRQDLAQALLVAGRADDARLAFDEALAARQQLVREFPANEQVRADLAQSQSAAGDFFANAGKLVDAGRTWDQAIETLEIGLKTNANSVPFQTALLQQLLHVADQNGQVGLWENADRYYRRAFSLQTPSEYHHWLLHAVVLIDKGDAAGWRALATQAVPRLSTAQGVDLLNLVRIFLLMPDAAKLFPDSVRRGAEVTYRERDWPEWCRAMTALRLGDAEKALPLLDHVADPLQELSVRAIVLHRLGRTAAAAEALAQADQIADKRMREGVAQEKLKNPDAWWADWLAFRMLRGEAHRAIHGRPMPESPYERLYRGRLFHALEQHDPSATEFIAAVTIRPDDADVWLTRSRIYARLGRIDRMTADLLHAQKLKGDDPNTWIATGRMLAERGEHQQADSAFARAAILGKGELSRFLEAGWWVVGPYPEQIDRTCPPEINPDPSKHVAAVDRGGNLKWQSVSTNAVPGSINFHEVIGSNRTGSYYALTYVHADRDRTAGLYLRTGSDLRIWVNGKLVLDGFAAWGIGGIQNNWLPVTLRKGRNEILVKTLAKNSWNEVQFEDAPPRRAFALMDLALWAEAADAWAEADRRAHLEPYRVYFRVWCLLAIGRNDEARRAYEEAVVRYEGSQNDALLSHLTYASSLTPAKGPDRDRWVTVFDRLRQKGDVDAMTPFLMAHAYYRAARFEEAEKTLRKLIAEMDKPWFHPLLASTLHYLGRHDEARKELETVEEQSAQLVKKALQAKTFELPMGGENIYRAHLPEAQKLIRGKVSPPTDDEKAFVAKARQRLAELDRADAYVRLNQAYPGNQRLQIALGRRHAQQDDWDEAARLFVQAALKSKASPQVSKEIGLIYADFNKWDDAALAFNNSLNIAAPKQSNWFSAQSHWYEPAVRSDEVFTRLAELRPTDRQLWIERVHFLCRNARWPDAVQAIAKVVELGPMDHLSWHLQAILLFQVGDHEGHRRVCKEMQERFANTKSELVAQRVGTAVLLGQPTGDAVAAVVQLMKTTEKTPSYNDWHGLTKCLAHIRLDEFDPADDALRRTTSPHSIVVSALRAIIEQKKGQTDAARQSLNVAVQRFAGAAKPGPGEMRSDWYIWIATNAIVREAEALVPAAPAKTAQVGLPPEELAAQRARRSRADRLATQAALAQIRFQIGQKAEADQEMRAVLAERERIAAEEPDNLDHRLDVAVTRLSISRLLAESDRIDDALKESTETLTVLDKLATAHPKYVRFRTEAALGVQALGDIHAKANRRGDALRAWQKGIDLLAAALKENPNARTVGAALAKAEERLANHYGSLTLWPEASKLLASAVRRPGGEGNAWRWLRAGQASLAAADVPEVKKLAAEAFERFRNVADSEQLTALVELMALAESPKETLAQMIPVAEQIAREKPSVGYLTILRGMYEYRAGQYEQAIQRLDVPEYRNDKWSKALIAMAHHRLGNAQEGEEWRVRAEEVYLTGLRKRTQQSTPLANEIWWMNSNEFAFYREAHELITGKPLPLDPLERLYRAQCYLHYGESDKAEAEFKTAVDVRPDDPTVVLARSRILEKLGRAREAAADRARALQLAEDALVKRPEDAVAASVLGDLLLEKIETKWTTINPVTATSKGGATLTVQPDHSVLASGTNPDTDVYTIEAEVTGPIGAVRLETILDASLPNGYAGRNGNFILSDVRVTTPTKTVKWARAFASFSQLAPTTKTNHHPIEAAIDADPSTGWAIFPRYTEPHWAVFVPVVPFGGEKTRITIRLSFENKNHVKHTLGRFRLSVAKESESITQNAWFLAASTPHAKVGAAYLASGKAKEAVDFLKKAVAANANPAAEDWLILALAHARLKEADQAKAACIKAGELLKPKGADNALVPLVREVAVSLGTYELAVRELIAAAAGDPPANLNEAIEKAPDQAIGYRNRAEWYGGRGRWKEALADLAEANRIQATTYTAMREGILLLYTGAIDEYREVCRTTLEKWAATTNNGEADQTLKTYLLIADYKGDAKQLARLVDVLASADKDADWYEWWVIAKALHEYRTGKHDDALATARDSRSRAPKTKGSADALIAINLAIEAMALHGKGDADESRKTLEQVQSMVKQHVPGIDRDWWHDWLTAHILVREAEALIAGMKPMPKK